MHFWLEAVLQRVREAISHTPTRSTQDTLLSSELTSCWRSAHARLNQRTQQRMHRSSVARLTIIAWHRTDPTKNRVSKRYPWMSVGQNRRNFRTEWLQLGALATWPDLFAFEQLAKSSIWSETIWSSPASDFFIANWTLKRWHQRVTFPVQQVDFQPTVAIQRSAVVIMCCLSSSDVCDTSVLWQNGWT